MRDREANIPSFNLKLTHPVNDPELIKRVFVHRSFLNEAEGAGLASNERLEFLGDAILSVVVSRMLFDRFPEASEGEMTRMRARLVNKRMLADMALKLKMDEGLLLGKGEANTGGGANPSILAGALEALFAAVCIDRGMESAFALIDALFSPLMESARSAESPFDYKPLLQEYTQRVMRRAPVYTQTRESGPAHKKVFDIEVSVNNEVLGRGSAPKKKEAEQEAAKEALETLKRREGAQKGG